MANAFRISNDRAEKAPCITFNLRAKSVTEQIPSLKSCHISCESFLWIQFSKVRYDIARRPQEMCIYEPRGHSLIEISRFIYDSFIIRTTSSDI